MYGRCQCGCETVTRQRGLQGIWEVLIFLALLPFWVLPAIIYYIVMDGRSACARCGRRV